MPLDERTSNILAATVQEFIRTGEPVSSGHLYDRYQFGIKPAMIRLILKSLDEAGYLEQPNYSAGRIPRDRGYEFYADTVLRDAEASDESRVVRALIESLAQKAVADFLERLSHEFGLLSVAAHRSAHETYKSGLETLVDQLDLSSRDELRAVIRDFESLDRRIEAMQEPTDRDDDIRFFIGRKSPVTKCESLSVIRGSFESDGERIVVFAIGPKRMNYEKVARAFKTLKVATRKHTHDR